MRVIGEIVGNGHDYHRRTYRLYLRDPAPQEMPKYLMSVVREDQPTRDGWCEVISCEPLVIEVGAFMGWTPTNGDLLIAADLVPAPPPMMAVPA